ncbi:MAG: Single-stranded DNA-specific exonuclease, DHH superfamily [Chloroflexi bacterium AL-W]|nr:Single-stranded DNA-specific exonuclease, DHH superfamily [Chloroflexi bacterium AL-N1]NOK69196.1 Single-stranded DNA-specific exonuclease, DHH superfamily [Chloroflexi bacterium AL-N10]NOK77179.1 Single-stranded DNA-specific exonuclease, DHH superfamily [Chloroflexi bacterium AL-N5]NOK83824.1 Single-stranded DNA-specific exonuclease, DHH superfamily [Chloroflexi bacterium AL-W]NOK91034.1 Single-stranded DNA-specific exonuclease, DHH superfamily [Chloroflexi bacterium AL-N15]
MSARKKRWIVRDSAPSGFLATMDRYTPLVATLLYQRGLRDPKDIDAFLTADYRVGLHDPFLMKDMQCAAERVITAINEHEPIAVYGDFDADGVTAVTLLVQVITAMGGDIRPYIPHRVREGYGLNTEAIDRLNAEGVRLLITVDCGISNTAEVAYANTVGLDIIVTDHHTPPEELPEAYAIINPKQPGCEYPYKQLVGVGIAFKLVQALVRGGAKMALRGRDLLDVVALGTVTDMGPLNGENRVLVKAGLESVNATERPGLRALLDDAGLVQGKIRASDISFMLGPRLNAAGRIDDAVLSYKLLLADDLDAARTLAKNLSEANRQRQGLTREIQEHARNKVKELEKDKNHIIVLDDEQYQAGIVGLVASKLVDEFARPVLLIERGAETSRGSARSVSGFNMIEALTSCGEMFVRYGGHSAAAGFTIETDRLPDLEAYLLDYAETHLSDELLMSMLEIDAETPLETLTWDLLDQLQLLEPFGQANAQPILMSRRVYVASAQAKGFQDQHLKLRITDGEGGPSYEAIAFRLGHLARYFQQHPWIDIAYTLEANEWNGNRKLQINIKDLRRAQ